MNIGVLGVGVGRANLGAAERPSARDIILDTAALASSLSLDQIHQLSQLHNLVIGHGNDTSSSSILVDGSTRTGSAVDGLTNGLDGGDQDIREESSKGSAIELKDTSLTGLFYLSDLGSLVSASTNAQDTGQPQLPMSTSTSGLISLPSLQSLQTITPAYLDTSLSNFDGISSSRDHLLELEYLPESLSLTKPFGSLSDLQALSVSALNEDYPSAYATVGPTTDVMDMSWLNQSNVIILGSDDCDSRDNQYHSSTISNSLREMYNSVGGDGCVATTFGMGHDQSYQDTATDGHYYGVNGSISSMPSYLPSLIELSISPSLSPMMLHYDSQGRIVTNVDAETGNMAGDSEGFLSDLNGLGHDGVESSFSGLKKQGGRVRDTEIGIEPTIVLRRAGFSGSGMSSANGITSHGSKRGQIQPAPVQYTNIPIPLPIPTRSRPTLLKGWQGDEKSDLVSSFRKKHKKETQMFVGQNKNKKRKRLGQPQSEDDESEEREKVASLRREMLGLRTISEDRISSALGDELSEEKDRKRRRIGSSKDKEKETKTDWDGSEEESESDSDSDTDIYCPSRSSSPAFDDYGSSSHMTNSSRRSGSAQTMTTVTTSMSSTYGEGDEEEQRQRKKNKGKAKGSAALALAKITMMSGKPAITPWGTYVPFPADENQGQDVFLEDDAEIRAGRRRRNGHIPLPVPVPHLIKKSRGRKVPYVAKEVTVQSDKNTSGSSKRVREGEQWKRMFVCEVPGCGKCFVRGEHLKRHVRSIHTHDKRTFFFFSRYCRTQ